MSYGMSLYNDGQKSLISSNFFTYFVNDSGFVYRSELDTAPSGIQLHGYEVGYSPIPYVGTTYLNNLRTAIVNAPTTVNGPNGPAFDIEGWYWPGTMLYVDQTLADTMNTAILNRTYQPPYGDLWYWKTGSIRYRNPIYNQSFSSVEKWWTYEAQSYTEISSGLTYWLPFMDHFNNTSGISFFPTFQNNYKLRSGSRSNQKPIMAHAVANLFRDSIPDGFFPWPEDKVFFKIPVGGKIGFQEFGVGSSVYGGLPDPSTDSQVYTNFSGPLEYKTVRKLSNVYQGEGNYGIQIFNGNGEITWAKTDNFDPAPYSDFKITGVYGHVTPGTVIDNSSEWIQLGTGDRDWDAPWPSTWNETAGTANAYILWWERISTTQWRLTADYYYTRNVTSRPFYYEAIESNSVLADF